MYNKIILDHFQHPRNQGKIAKPDGLGQVGNPVCGDIMKIYIKIDQERGQAIIKDIKFETLGCAAAIANSSMLTTVVKGKLISQALRVTKNDIVKKLGGDVPKNKIHCSMLAIEALKEAVDDWQKKNKKVRPKRVRRAKK
ncbi:MAG: iron-sulfur cluster assembly scaffold protein [Patescibacteria group bacterium]